MNTPFKMKGWSPFTQKTHPDHPVTPPTKEQKKKSKGLLNWTKQMLKRMRAKDPHADYGTYGRY